MDERMMPMKNDALTQSARGLIKEIDSHLNYFRKKARRETELEKRIVELEAVLTDLLKAYWRPSFIAIYTNMDPRTKGVKGKCTHPVLKAWQKAKKLIDKE